MVVTFDPGTDESGRVTFDPGTDEGVGVVQLPLTLAQMKGLWSGCYL